MFNRVNMVATEFYQGFIIIIFNTEEHEQKRSFVIWDPQAGYWQRSDTKRSMFRLARERERPKKKRKEKKRKRRTNKMDFPFSHRRVLYIGPMDWCGSSLNRVFFWSVLFFVFFGPALWLCVSLANEAVATALEIDRFFFLSLISAIHFETVPIWLASPGDGFAEVCYRVVAGLFIWFFLAASVLLEEVLEEVIRQRSAGRVFLHPLMQPHLKAFVLPVGQGDVFYAIQYLMERCRVCSRTPLVWLPRSRSAPSSGRRRNYVSGRDPAVGEP